MRMTQLDIEASYKSMRITELETQLAILRQKEIARQRAEAKVNTTTYYCYFLPNV